MAHERNRSQPLVLSISKSHNLENDACNLQWRYISQHVTGLVHPHLIVWGQKTWFPYSWLDTSHLGKSQLHILWYKQQTWLCWAYVPDNHEAKSLHTQLRMPTQALQERSNAASKFHVAKLSETMPKIIFVSYITVMTCKQHMSHWHCLHRAASWAMICALETATDCAVTWCHLSK